MIKICGITNLEDALTAANAGATHLGFIFADSPRQIQPKIAAEIISKLPASVKKVGVFVDEEIGKVNTIVRDCTLDLVQLHGNEAPEYCQKMIVPVIKAFRIKDKNSLDQLKDYEDCVQYFLLDTFAPDKAGGTGKTFDWELALEAKKLTSKPIILSGGLTVDNIELALHKVSPFGVDINSGIELSPGKKDQNKLKKIIELIRQHP